MIETCVYVKKDNFVQSLRIKIFDDVFILQGGQDYLIGRTNNNSVDLNRNFPDLDRIMYSYEAEHIDHNNHLLDQVTQLTEPVSDTLIK